MLRFDGFQKYYDDRLIISADMELHTGNYWLKGGNGSGKTTLIKSIAGLIPYKGNILINSISIRKDSTTYRRSINYAEAEPLYPDFLTGNELISFYIKTKGGNKAQADELMETLGAGSYLAQKVGTYSSGMAKKLSLILAFMGMPKLILLDEPLITLDVASVAALQNVVQQRLDAGVSILITSHQELPHAGLRPTLLVIEDATLKQAAL